MQTDIDDLISVPLPPFLFNQLPPSPQLQVSVIVPARNEGYQLTATLDALRQQQDADGSPLPPSVYEVLLLTNNCTDLSYEIATNYQQQHPDFPLYVANIQLPPAKANIGTVRRMLMDEAHRRLTSLGRQDGIIASTDGDTVVDSRWVQAIMYEIANGNDAVGGRILTHPEQTKTRLYHLRDVMYRTLVAKAEAMIDPSLHDPWPRHFQHFGASIAVTCQMYEQAGRLPERPYLEDEAFYRALIRRDAKVRQSPHVKVFTSTRTQGRVAIGFSEQLRYWSTMDKANQCQVAESAEAIIVRLQNRHRLRTCWHQRDRGIDTTTIQRIANELLVNPKWILDQLTQCRFFGELWEKVDEKMRIGQWSSQWQLVPITTAIRDMRIFLVDHTVDSSVLLTP